MKSSALRALPILVGCIWMTACGSGGPEFVLPEGDAAAGEATFVRYSCNTCHTVAGVDLPAPAVDGPVKITLGGRVSRVKSYSELVTSVINPSHRLFSRRRANEVSDEGESLMTVYNDVMTVTELVNLVAFLESTYEEFDRPGYRYPTYSLPGLESE